MYIKPNKITGACKGLNQNNSHCCSMKNPTLKAERQYKKDLDISKDSLSNAPTNDDGKTDPLNDSPFSLYTLM